MGFLCDSVVKNLPAKQMMSIGSLDQEDSLETESEIHFNILAWEIPCSEEPTRLQSMG